MFLEFCSKKLRDALPTIDDFVQFISDCEYVVANDYNNRKDKNFCTKHLCLKYYNEENIRTTFDNDRCWLFILSGSRIDILGMKQITNLGNFRGLTCIQNGIVWNRLDIGEILSQWWAVYTLPKNSKARKLDLQNKRFENEK